LRRHPRESSESERKETGGHPGCWEALDIVISSIKACAQGKRRHKGVLQASKRQ
jgi:hypothetical protein